MTLKQLSIGLFGAALLFGLGCQEEGTSPSEPVRSLAGAGLPDDIRRDIRCLFNGGAENAMIKRFRDAEKSKGRTNKEPLKTQTGALINDIFEAYEDDELNDPPGSPCGGGETTAEVTERLLINLAAFGEHGTLTPGFLTDGQNGKIFTYRLADGTTQTTEDGCVGFQDPGQTDPPTTFNTCTIFEPTSDPGFDTEGEDTAPFWLQVDCTFSGPYTPKILAAFFVIDDGELFGFPAPPEGTDLTACTIRGGVILCDGEEDLVQEVTALVNACVPDEIVQRDGFGGLVDRFFQSRIVDVKPLWANPGGLGLRSSFSSPFGAQFDEEGTGSISGTVFGCFASPIGGADVELFEGTIGVEEEPFATTITDGTNGNYFFEDVPVGSYTVRASAEGFDSNTEEATVTSGENTDADVTLTPPGGCIG